MERIATQEQLRDYLESLGEGYGTLYAAALWNNQLHARSMLANSSVEALMQAGVTWRMHAGDIKAKAGMAGEVEAALLAVHLARLSHDMHLALKATHASVITPAGLFVDDRQG